MSAHLSHYSRASARACSSFVLADCACSECIVEGEGSSAKRSTRAKRDEINEEFSWLKNTRWNWNNWREVIFRADGAFLAPAENCERGDSPKCRWSTNEDRIFVECVLARTLPLVTECVPM